MISDRAGAGTAAITLTFIAFGSRGFFISAENHKVMVERLHLLWSVERKRAGTCQD